MKLNLILSAPTVFVIPLVIHLRSITWSGRTLILIHDTDKNVIQAQKTLKILGNSACFFVVC